MSSINRSTPPKVSQGPFSEANKPFVFQSSFFKKGYTPRRLTWNPNNEGLEDVFPFHMGDS